MPSNEDPIQAIHFFRKYRQKIRMHIGNRHLAEVAKGSMIALSFRLIGMGINLIFTLLVSRWYGPKGAGIYGITVTVTLVLIMLGSLGFGASVVRFVSQFAAENRLSKIRDLYHHVLFIVLPVSGLLSLLFFLFAEEAAVGLFSDATLEPAFKVIAISVPFAILYRIHIEFIRGFKNIALSEYIRHLNRNIVNILMLLALSLFFSNPYLPVWSYTTAIIASALTGGIHVRRYLSQIPKKDAPSFSMGELLKTSTPMLMTDFINLLNHQIDIVMMGLLSTTASVGVYSTSLKLSEMTALSVVAINTIAMPKFSELFWKGKREDLGNVVRFVSKIRFFAATPFLILFIIRPGFFMGLFGEDFVCGKNALLFLSIGEMINAASGPCASILNMIGRQKAIRNIMIIATLLNIGLNLILIPSHGVTGAAMATMLSTFFWNIAAVIFIRRSEKIKTYYIPFLVRTKRR